MGERSQIFVRYEDFSRHKILAARYFQYNSDASMVSRARGILDWLKRFDPKCRPKDLVRIIDTDFDAKDCQISTDLIKEFDDDSTTYTFWTLNYSIFKAMDNQDGKLFVDVLPDKTIKYAFTDSEGMQILTAAQYMKWDCDEDWQDEWQEQPYLKNKVETVLSNIDAIDNGDAILMTEDELQEFTECSYEHLLQNVPFH